MFRDALGCVHRSFPNFLTITNKTSLLRVWDSKYESLSFNEPSDSILWKHMKKSHFYPLLSCPMWFCYQAYVIRVTNSSSRHIACAWVLAVWETGGDVIRNHGLLFGKWMKSNEKHIGKPSANWIHKFFCWWHIWTNITYLYLPMNHWRNTSSCWGSAWQRQLSINNCPIAWLKTHLILRRWRWMAKMLYWEMVA